MNIIDELIDAYLHGDYETTYVLNVKTMEITLDGIDEPRIDWDDYEAVKFLRLIPQIENPEAYRLREKFAQTQDIDIAEKLFDVLRGKKPFRSFKDRLFELDIVQEWYDFENDYVKKIMIEWLEVNT